jgi:hypothetical protein
MNEASLQFHIKENDYFGILATVLDLVSQDLQKKHRSNAETLSRLRDPDDVPSAMTDSSRTRWPVRLSSSAKS